ncbi:MAG: hypothetical protein ABI372_08710 [Ginsengibacter sp.]
MSLDNIQLSKETCQNLFAKSLIEIKDEVSEVEGQKVIGISSLGENQQQILFLIKDSESKFLPDDEMILLSNLLAACKLSMADITLVNYYLSPHDYNSFIDNFHPKKVLLFGVTTEDLGLPFSIPFFQIQKFQEQQYLTAPLLKKFLNNTDLKKELWTCLQKLFLKK